MKSSIINPLSPRSLKRRSSGPTSPNHSGPSSSAKKRRVDSGSAPAVANLTTELRDRMFTLLPANEQDKINKSLQRLQASYATLKSENTLLRNSNDTLKTEIDTLKVKPSSLVNTLRAERATLRAGNKILRNSNDTLRTENNTLRVDHDALRTQVEELTKTNSKLYSTLFKTQRQLPQLTDTIREAHKDIRQGENTGSIHHSTNAKTKIESALGQTGTLLRTLDGATL